MRLAQSDFDNEFTDWFTSGAISSVVWVLIVLALVAVVLKVSR